jgi:hypothetical protein
MMQEQKAMWTQTGIILGGVIVSIVIAAMGVDHYLSKFDSRITIVETWREGFEKYGSENARAAKAEIDNLRLKEEYDIKILDERLNSTVGQINAKFDTVVEIVKGTKASSDEHWALVNNELKKHVEDTKKETK